MGLKLPKIPSKKAMYKLYLAGAFGNRVATTRCYKEAMALKHVEIWAVRGMQRGTSYLDGPFFPEDLPIADTRASILCDSDYVFSETTEYNSVVVQGELGLFPGSGWTLRYTHEDVYLKHLHRAKHFDVHGALAVKAFVRKYSDTSKHLLDLVECYAGPGDGCCVVEFSVHERPAGVENKHTLVWEVRTEY